MPDVLKANGILSRLNVRDAGTVHPPSYDPDPDPRTGIRNAHAIRRYAERLADTVEALVGLRRRGDYGLIFIDGHRDFQTPATSATGGAAGMDLALATGHGPDLLTRFDGFETLVCDEAVVALGFRDVVPEAEDGSRAISDTQITLLDLAPVRHLSPGRAAEEALAVIKKSSVQGFWIHVDVDVLDSQIMPAVDSPEPGGMTYDELKALLVPLLRDEDAAGVELTIFDPDKDPDGEMGRQFVDWVVEVLKEAMDGA
ncbi:MAG TPA: arginase family protein [Rhodothermales bacterium]|nr:arginase family protein [Rhodothermales bacterium]